jgi:hypothetical protein
MTRLLSTGSKWAYSIAPMVHDIVTPMTIIGPRGMLDGLDILPLLYVTLQWRRGWINDECCFDGVLCDVTHCHGQEEWEQVKKPVLPQPFFQYRSSRFILGVDIYIYVYMYICCFFVFIYFYFIVFLFFTLFLYVTFYCM